MITITECFGFSLTDEFGDLDSNFQKLLTEDEIDYINDESILNEPCIVSEYTEEKKWLAIAISGRYPRSYSAETLTEKVKENIQKSSPMMQSIYNKIIEHYDMSFDDLILYGEI